MAPPPPPLPPPADPGPSPRPDAPPLDPPKEESPDPEVRPRPDFESSEEAVDLAPPMPLPPPPRPPPMLSGSLTEVDASSTGEASRPASCMARHMALAAKMCCDVFFKIYFLFPEFSARGAMVWVGWVVVREWGLERRRCVGVRPR